MPVIHPKISMSVRLMIRFGCAGNTPVLWEVNVVGIYADYAISGAHLKSRPEALRLLKEAQEIALTS